MIRPIKSNSRKTRPVSTPEQFFLYLLLPTGERHDLVTDDGSVMNTAGCCGAGCEVAPPLNAGFFSRLAESDLEGSGDYIAARAVSFINEIRMHCERIERTPALTAPGRSSASAFAPVLTAIT
jgi:hypothetical protein